MGKTILISSHILPELADLCNTVGIIEQRRAALQRPGGPTSSSRAKAGTVLHVAVGRAPRAGGGDARRRYPTSRASPPTTGTSRCRSKTGVEDYSFIPRQLVAAGFPLTMLKEEEVNLETAFMRLTKGMVQ